MQSSLHVVCHEGLTVAECAQHTGTEGGSHPIAVAVFHVMLATLQLFSINENDSEVYYTGDETFEYKLMTNSKSG